jgi:hypothetical protein
MLQFRWFQHFKALVIAASALFLMGICCGFVWLNNHGFEGEWGERIAAELAKQGIHAEFESVRFSPTRGIIAKKVLFYTDQSRTAVWARIPVLRFDVDRGKAFRGELQIRRVILSDAHLSLPISRGGPALQISNFTGSASLDREDRLLLEGARGTLGGMTFLLDLELDEFDLGNLSKDREPGTTLEAPWTIAPSPSANSAFSTVRASWTCAPITTSRTNMAPTTSPLPSRLPISSARVSTITPFPSSLPPSLPGSRRKASGWSARKRA